MTPEQTSTPLLRELENRVSGASRPERRRRFNSQIMVVVALVASLVAGALLEYSAQPLYALFRAKGSAQQSLYQRYYQMKIGLFSVAHGRADIALVGDSLIDGGNLPELLPGRVINRGIAGDTTEGVLKRIAGVIAQNPRAVIIEIGVNDLLRGADPTLIAENELAIAKQFSSHGIRVLLTLNILVGRTERKPARSAIELINSQVEALAKASHIETLDLNPLLAPNGFLLPKYTWDGVHLTGAGYQIWAREIAQRLSRTQQTGRLSEPPGSEATSI